MGPSVRGTGQRAWLGGCGGLVGRGQGAGRPVGRLNAGSTCPDRQAACQPRTSRGCPLSCLAPSLGMPPMCISVPCCLIPCCAPCLLPRSRRGRGVDGRGAPLAGAGALRLCPRGVAQPQHRRRRARAAPAAGAGRGGGALPSAVSGRSSSPLRSGPAWPSLLHAAYACLVSPGGPWPASRCQC